METNTSTLATSIVLLEIPSLFWAWWSFKMSDSVKRSYSNVKPQVHFKGHKWIEHTGSSIFGAGVCPLGKFGAFVIFLWTILMSGLLLYYAHSAKNKEKAHDVFRILGIVHAIVIGIIALLSLIMNYPLFIRTLPYFITQVAVAWLLIG